MYVSSLPTYNLANKTVFLRTDFNVPLHNGNVMCDFKLRKSRATIDYLLEHNATIIIGTHIGRPVNRDPLLSTQNLVPWFNEHGYQITFCSTIEEAQQQASTHRLILLENLRFFSRGR